MNLFKKKSQIITLDSGETYRWKKGIKLEAVEKSAFIIPGALFIDGTPVGELLEISDKEAEIVAVSEPKENSYPDIAAVINKGVSMKLNRNCEVIHVHLKGEEKRRKKFYIRV